MWFKTTGSGVLFSSGHDRPGDTSPGGADMPVLYVGTDGKLYGHFWNLQVAGIASSGTVNDGQWHHVALMAAATTQSLYLDGGLVGTQAGQLYNDDPHDFVGVGYVASRAWPAAPTDVWGHLSGSISDVSVYRTPLDPGTVSAHHTAGLAPVAATLDADVAYRAAVVQASPLGYWRLHDTAGTVARDELTWPATVASEGVNNTLATTTPGPTGHLADVLDPHNDWNGSTPEVQLPTSAAPQKGANTVELWFQTQGPGVLFSYQDFPVENAHTSTDMWNPALYVGTDGKLYGKFWGASQSMVSTAWSGKAYPYCWFRQSSKVNRSIGGQAGSYQYGYKPTQFLYGGVRGGPSQTVLVTGELTVQNVEAPPSPARSMATVEPICSISDLKEVELSGTVTP